MNVPRLLLAAIIGLFPAGIVLALVVPALGYLPRWLPWLVIFVFVGLAYWALSKSSHRRQVH